MASFTKISEAKRARNARNAGSARKAKQGLRSTLSYDELFAKCGEPRDAKAEPDDSASKT
jgi:hypothetical protein